MATDGKFAPSFTLCRLFERVSAKGNVYLVGRLAGAKIAILKSSDTTDDGVPIWNVVLSEAPQKADGERETRRAVRDAPSEGEQVAARGAQRHNRYPSRDTEPDARGPALDEPIPF